MTFAPLHRKPSPPQLASRRPGQPRSAHVSSPKPDVDTIHQDREGEISAPPVTSPRDSFELEAERAATDAPPMDGSRYDTSSRGSTSLASLSTHDHGLDFFPTRGTPLSREAQQNFQGYFGTDLSRVRLHDGKEANHLAKRLNADAVTYGSDIAFRSPAMYRHREFGSRLLAHELAHVVQGGDRIYRSVTGAMSAVRNGNTQDAKKEARGYFSAGAAKSFSPALSGVSKVLSAALPGMSPGLMGVAAAAAVQAQEAPNAQELATQLDKLLASERDRDVVAAGTYIVRRLEPSRMLSVPASKQLGGIPPRVYVRSNTTSAANRSMSRDIQLRKGQGWLEPGFAPGVGKSPTIDENVNAFFQAGFRQRVNAAQRSIPDPSKWIGLSAEQVMERTFFVLSNTNTTKAERDEAEAVRTAAGRASFDAIASTLNVEESNLTSDEETKISDWLKNKENRALADAKNMSDLQIAMAAGVRINRYTEFDGAFKCNTYMTDFADLHPSGPFLPKVWWTKPDEIKSYFAVDEISAKSPDVGYMSRSPRGINEWLRTVGPDYGWEPVPGNNEQVERNAQALADAGEFVVFTAKTVGGGSLAGHSGVVAPQVRDNSPDVGAKEFDPNAVVGKRFVRSQAGAIGVKQGRRGGNIFDSAHFDGGFWVYRRGNDKTAGKDPYVFEK